MVVPRVVAQDADDEEIIELDPFVVAEDENMGYMATHTLAGTRIRTELSDVGSAISVVTEEFLEDTGATDNQSLLVYTTNTEVSGPQGNFANVSNTSPSISEENQFTSPSTQTRVRGLAEADNTRDYFLTNIPWDGFNVERVDMQRGPNAILFGLGSPAGIINTTLSPASFFNGGDVSFRFGSYGSTRLEANFNRQIIEDELAVRVAALQKDQKFRQDPAFEDDGRIYTALRWDPAFLNNGFGRTTLRANYEHGNLSSNRPRQLPPVDRVSAFFRSPRVGGADSAYSVLPGLGGQAYGVYQMQDDLAPYDPDRGQNRVTLDNGSFNPNYLPAIGDFGNVFGGAVYYFNHDTDSRIFEIYQPEWTNVGAVGTDGVTLDSNIEGQPYQRLRGIANYAQYALNATNSNIPNELRANLPFADFGQYKDFSLTDPSIFNFYRNLIDGPTKGESANWDAYNVSLQQTFLDNRVGFDVTFDHQEYENESFRLFSGGNVTINVDINADFAFSRFNPPASYPNAQNPNAGRPFIGGSYREGNSSFMSEREVLRATAFGELRASDFLDGDSFLARLLGRLVVTGLYVDDSNETENRSWARYATSQELAPFVGGNSIGSDFRIVQPIVYLGDSLIGKSGASGLNLPRVMANPVPDSGQMLYFSSTWDPAAGIDAADPWVDPETGGDSTQNENPANYVGWTRIPVNILSADEIGRDQLITGAQLARAEVESWAVVGQAYFWDEAVVGTLGYREDTATSFQHQADTGTQGTIDLTDASYRLPDEGTRFKGDSLSQSVALHLHRLPFGEHLPVDISLYYNTSENFQPTASRVDVFGQSIGAPSGETTDRSILIATKDNRFSLKITKFETLVTDASSTGFAANEVFFIGGIEARGASWANMAEFDLVNGGEGTATGENTYSPLQSETAQAEEQFGAETPEAIAFAEELAAQREAAAVAGWRQHQANVRALSERITGDPNAFYDAWNIDTDDRTYRVQEQDLGAKTPQGLAFTQDARSEGYEYEFTANPTPNWRISINASEVEAFRLNVGGSAVQEFVDVVTTDVTTTAAGDLKLWWGAAGSPTFDEHWLGSGFYANYQLVTLLEGTPTPEIRKWRFNLVTNYSFVEGFLAGLDVGVGYRWQDDVIIGYGVETGPDGITQFNIDDPFYGPSEDAVDVWLGYGRELADGIDWRIQLNVRNLGDGDRLIPISTQPDGTVAQYRIGPHQEWFITNTFSF